MKDRVLFHEWSK